MFSSSGPKGVLTKTRILDIATFLWGHFLTRHEHTHTYRLYSNTEHSRLGGTRSAFVLWYKAGGETERHPDFVRERKCVQEEDAVWNTLVFQPVALMWPLLQQNTHSRKGAKIQRVIQLSDLIKNILIWVPKMNKSLTGLEQYENEY